jgi:predicted nucleotidyltransferase
MQSELQDIFGRPVDMVERAAVERSENYIRRNSVLRTAQTLYGS